MNILDKIIAHKRKEVEIAKVNFPVSSFTQADFYERSPFSLSQKLKSSDGINIIAEYKRASPSKGLINVSDSSPSEVARAYELYGASAISTLTDSYFFKAQSDDFTEVRKEASIPILRKEFIIDDYQLHEAKAMGADVILLIGAVLEKLESEHLTNMAHNLGIEVLYEIHGEEDIDKMPEKVDIVGINNRDLKTFTVDYQHSIDMLQKLPSEYPKISESGISNTDTIIELHKAGFDGFLIGEAFMKEENPGKAFHNFITDCQTKLTAL